MLGAMTDEPVNVGEAFRTNLQIIFSCLLNCYRKYIILSESFYARKIYTINKSKQQ